MIELAGQEVFRPIIPVSLHDPFAGLLFDDLSDHLSFAALEHWHSVLMEEGDAERVLTSVVCNTIDLSEDLAESFAQRTRARFFKVLALNGNSISELFGYNTQQIAEGGKRFITEIPSIKGKPGMPWLFSNCDSIVAEFPLDFAVRVQRMTIKSRH
jgi:GTPase SAR1 family protein